MLEFSLPDSIIMPMNMVANDPIFRAASKAAMAFLMVFCLSAAALSAPLTSKNLVQISGTVPLGSTREDVIKIMGKPDSPLSYDFTYKRGSAMIMIIFSDTTNRVEAVIVQGKNPKYCINNLTVGSRSEDVEKTFGKPEKVYNYKKSGVECWLYLSKKVSFALKSGKVTSFSVLESDL